MTRSFPDRESLSLIDSPQRLESHSEVQGPEPVGMHSLLWDFSFFQGLKALWRVQGWVASEYEAEFSAPPAVSCNMPPSPRCFAADFLFLQSSSDGGRPAQPECQPAVSQWWLQFYTFGWYLGEKNTGITKVNRLLPWETMNFSKTFHGNSVNSWSRQI